MWCFLRNQKFSAAGDIWALMIVFIEILQYGARPYGNHTNASVMWMLQNGEYELIKEILLEEKDYLSTEALEMFHSCLCPAGERWTAKQLTSRLNKNFRVYKHGVEYLPIRF